MKSYTRAMRNGPVSMTECFRTSQMKSNAGWNSAAEYGESLNA